MLPGVDRSTIVISVASFRHDNTLVRQLEQNKVVENVAAKRVYGFIR